MKKPNDYQEELLKALQDLERLQESYRSLLADFERLYNAIWSHQHQTGHNLCWENDLELWKTIDPSVAYPHATLPPEREFEQRCKEYFLSRKAEP